MDDHSARSAAYWDAHAGEHLTDPAHWEANAAVAAFQLKILRNAWGDDRQHHHLGAFLAKYGPFEKLASICCGTGILERTVWETRTSNLEVHGFDVSEGSLELARNLSAEMPGVRYFQADTNSLDIGTENYDVAFAHGACITSKTWNTVFPRFQKR